MADFENTVLVNIASTTRSAGRGTPGTIVAKKKGDWIWWAASALLGLLVLYTMYRPQWLTSLFV